MGGGVDVKFKPTKPLFRQETEVSLVVEAVRLRASFKLEYMVLKL